MIRRFPLSALVFLTICAGLCFDCGSVATVRPLAPEERALSISLGGPVATLPGIADVPLPYSVVRYRWGVADRLEAHVGIHPTMLVFGTIGLDAGLSCEFLRQRGVVPSLCVGINPTVWVNPFNQAAGFAPQAEAVASWYLARRILFYTGGQALFQLEKPYVPWAALAGAEFRLGRYLGIGLEVKWYAPFEDSEFRVVNFPISPARKGALGAVIGFAMYPGGADE